MSNSERGDRYRRPPQSQVSISLRKPSHTSAIGSLTVTCPVCGKGCRVWGKSGEYKFKEHGNPATNEVCTGSGTKVTGLKTDPP